MDKAGKTEALEAYKKVFAGAGVVVVTQYSGLTVAEMTDLRVKLKAEGANLKVIKNRLAVIALGGTGGDDAAKLFTGPVAIAFSPDPVSAPKVVAAYAKANEKLKMIGALMGDTVLDQNGVKALATLPSLDQLRGTIIGLIQAPATKIAGVLAAPAGAVARVIGAYAAKDEAAKDAA